jgi:hypothetical protein
MGPGSTSAFTRVFDTLWAGTTRVRGRSRDHVILPNVVTRHSMVRTSAQDWGQRFDPRAHAIL